VLCIGGNFWNNRLALIWPWEIHNPGSSLLTRFESKASFPSTATVTVLNPVTCKSPNKKFMRPFIYTIAAFFIGALVACGNKQQAELIPVEKPTKYDWKTFSMGADLSYVPQLKDRGAVYKDSGVAKDVFKIFSDHGCNTVRLRLWHTPSKFENRWGDQTYNDFMHVEELIRRSKALGMAVSLDLHYSDTWADPGKQFIPAAWAKLDLKTLQDSVYQYTLSVLNKLKAKNLTPEMIQIGNETNGGMLWPVGKTTGDNFSAFSKLLNSGIKAVRDFSTTSEVKPLVIIHAAQLQHAEWWTKNVMAAGTTDFDILGVSHYNDWSKVHSTDSVTMVVKKLKEVCGKEVMIVETAYWWNTKDTKGYPISQKALKDYPFTSEGQYNYLKDLTQAVINGGGKGIHYWAPDFINNNRGGEMTVRSLVDSTGNVLPGIDFMNTKYTF
jgi:arabinogalactan endo-1,4-beta-galactosidase